MKLPALLTRGTNAAEGIIDGVNGLQVREFLFHDIPYQQKAYAPVYRAVLKEQSSE